MLGKKILAGIFAALTLIKLAFLLISPEQWLGATQAFLGHYTLVMAIYLVLLVITGYFVFTRIDLIDVAVVMLFTVVLLGLSLLPYLASIPQLREAIVSVGFAKVWPAWIIWAAIAVAVLYRIFAGKKEQERWRAGLARRFLCGARCAPYMFSQTRQGRFTNRPYVFLTYGGWEGSLGRAGAIRKPLASPQESLPQCLKHRCPVKTMATGGSASLQASMTS